MLMIDVVGAAVLALGLTTIANAQGTAPPAATMPAAPPIAETVLTPPPVSASTCELHVFPTLEGQAVSTGWLSGFGIIGAVADAAAHKDANVNDADYLKNALGPKFQVSALQSIDVVKALNLPDGTNVSYETPVSDRGITTKVRTRLSPSTAACYAELIITQNLYRKAAIYGRSLNNRFIFKDFREGKTETDLKKGRGGNGLNSFPPKDESERAAAEADLRDAFTKNFFEYSKGI